MKGKATDEAPDAYVFMFTTLSVCVSVVLLLCVAILTSYSDHES